MYYVYILESEKSARYYIGYAEDVETRLSQHNEGKVKSTRFLRPFKLVYIEQYETGTEARQREYYLKTLKSRKVIQGLINGVGL